MSPSPTAASARILDGKRIAEDLLCGLAAQVEARLAAGKRRPGLAVVLVGQDPASAVYVRMKREDCAQVGIESFHHEPRGDVSQEELAERAGLSTHAISALERGTRTRPYPHTLRSLAAALGRPR